MNVEVTKLSDVAFSKRDRSSKYDAYLEPIAALDEGECAVLTPPEGVKLQSFAQSIRSAVKDGVECKEGYKFRTRNTEDGKLAVWWADADKEEPSED